MNPAKTPDGQIPADSVRSMAAEAGVDGRLLLDLLHELGDRYGAYRAALAFPFDPVSTLGLTGEVLASVRRLLTVAGELPAENPNQETGGP